MANFIRQFLYDLEHSFYDSEFYADIHTRSFWSGVRNFLFIGLIVSVVFVASFFVVAHKHISFSNIKNFVVTTYPDELELRIEDGVLSKNVPGPYIIPIQDETIYEEEGYANLVVIDTDEGIGVEDLKRYKTMALFTQDTLYVTGETNHGTEEIQIIALNTFDDFTIDESVVEALVEKLHPVYYVLLVVAPLFVVIFMTAGMLFSYLISSLLGALVVLIVSKIRTLNYRFRDAYVVAQFAMLPVIAYDLVTDILGFGNMFSLGALVFIAIVVINVKGAQADPAT